MKISHKLCVKMSVEMIKEHEYSTYHLLYEVTSIAILDPALKEQQAKT
jgi:hypothetical protein